MSLKLSIEQQNAVANAGGERPVQVVDPATQISYVLVPVQEYERLWKLIAGDAFDLREAYPLMDAAARAAGWDDPAEDLYDDLDPRRTA